jgi:cytochrome c-type biogenesis protein CcmH/NrfG
VAIVVAGAFALGVAISYLGSPGGGSNQQTQGGQPTAADQQAEALVNQLRRQVTATPTDSVLWVQLGNAYFDWGDAQQRDNRQLQANANFSLAADAYAKGLSYGKKDDPNVRTDMATALFYAGESATAIKEIESVLKKNPRHENALLNSGVFYANSGQPAKARVSWTRYLALYPKGQGVDFVKQQLTNLK